MDPGFADGDVHRSQLRMCELEGGSSAREVTGSDVKFYEIFMR